MAVLYASQDHPEAAQGPHLGPLRTHLDHGHGKHRRKGLLRDRLRPAAGRQLTAVVTTRLKRMQYRPGLIDSFLAKTGLDLALP
jgi:hypothetical protein